MTIAIGCNLADGVVLGADSAMTLANAAGVLKVYNDAEKLFTLYSMPLAMVTYGSATLENRTIQSHIREFEATHNPEEISQSSVEDVCKRLWTFLRAVYERSCQAAGMDLAVTPIEQRPALGLLVGGFGAGQYLSEVWELAIHADTADRGVIAKRPRGVFGCIWKGMTEGVVRFHKGFSFGHLNAVIETIKGHAGVTIDTDLRRKIDEVVRSAEYYIPFDGMPLQEGVDYVRFLLDVMINQTRFVVGAPMCGGRVRIAVVQTTGVQWVTETPFLTSH